VSSGKSNINRNPRKKGRRVVLRRTLQHTSGVTEQGDEDSTVTVSMKDKEDEKESEDENDDEETKSGHDKVSKTKRKRWTRNKKSRRSPLSRRGRTGIEKPRAIIDPGTEIDVIGGVGWHVLNKVDNMDAQLDGALVGMGGRSLPLVSAATAIDHKTEGTI
jgi:hypothetical protein